MSRSSRPFQSLIACLSIAAVAWLGGERPGAAADAAFREQVVPLVTRFCVECHGAKDPEGDLSLAAITPAMETPLQIAVWKQVLDRLDGLQMPPIEAEQPSADERGRAIGWIKSALRARGERFDELKPLASSRGNRVDHDALFSAPARGPAGTAGRVWRVSARAYTEFMKRIDGDFMLNLMRSEEGSPIKCPWGLPETWDFSDYSAAHRLTEAELEIHVINCTTLAKALRQRRALPAVEAVAAAGKAATPEQIAVAVREAFTKLLKREPGPEEAERYGGYLSRRLAVEDPAAAEMLLVSLLSHPEVLYRVERPGAGADAIQEPRALMRAIALALTDREPDAELVKAVDAGQLRTAAEVRGQVRRILDDESIPKPRILQFFREYFDYTPAESVFKDPASTTRQHRIRDINCGQGFQLAVKDTDALVEWVLAGDRQVLRTLLTTPKVCVGAEAIQGRARVLRIRAEEKKRDAERAAREGKPFDPQDKKYAVEEFRFPGHVGMWARQTYGFMSLDEWLSGQFHGVDLLDEFGLRHAAWSGFRLTPEMFDKPVPEPIDPPPGQRMGMLTQPAWLIAQSGNFDNHPIHRGRWIREKLLGGTIPDVPITVNAMLPDEPHHGLRERMRVTREEYCWNCHRLMDPLGLPFEQFDHFARFRIAEIVEDKEATAAARAKNPLSGPTMRMIPFETTGVIEASGDPSIDGPVQDPFELIERLAKSKRVEQVFVRHVFRFFLGRNETLADGPTLQAAHKAYVDSDGSLKALLVSLLSSDPFLCRTGGGAADGQDGPAAAAAAASAAR